MRAGPAAALSACLALAGCGAGEGGTPAPLRAPVAMEDEVGTVDRAQLVGRWQCRELNPIPGRQALLQSVTFEESGKGLNSAILDMAQAGGPPLGRMAADFTYDWRVEGERIVVSNVQSDVRAADDSVTSGFMAGLTQLAINAFSSQAEPGTSEVLRLDGRELVMRNAEVDDAPVLGCTRA